MSSITLQNTKLTFDVTIVAVDKNNNGKSLPLDIGSISNLEINDNLIDFGITGSITYSNWFQIVDKIGVTEGRDKKTLYITIDIESEDDREKEDETKKISFIGLMESSSSNGGNIADMKQTYKFEEAITSRLKKITLTSLEGVQTSGSAASIMESIFNISKTSYKNSVSDTSSVNLRDIWENNESVYITLYKLYNTLRIGGGQRRLPLIKAESNKEEREIQIKELITDRHLEFIDAYINNRGGDFRDVYQEEFLVGPEERETGNASLYNKVENYDHIKPNIGQLRQSLWGAYKLSGWKEVGAAADLSNVRSEFTNLEIFVEEFEKYINQKSNIPEIKEKEQKTFELEPLSSTSGSTDIIKDIVYNKLWKSFIFRNEAVVLRVKGQVYRKPGVFITIQGALNTRYEPVTDLWFVIRNKHIFSDGNYENEITAVRFLGKNEKNS